MFLLLKPSNKLIRSLCSCSSFSSLASPISYPSSSSPSSPIPLSFVSLATATATATATDSSSADDLNPTNVAASFKDWFRSGTTVLDRIYTILSSCPDGPELDSALSSLGLRLSEELVLKTLAHNPHPTALPNYPAPAEPSGSSKNNHSNRLLLLRLKFFDWAAQQRNTSYRHTLPAYHCIFRILSRSSRADSVLRWLHHLSPTGLRDEANPYSRARLHDVLVLGYAVAGRPKHALHLLSRMRFQGLDLSPFAYHVLLNSLVDAGIFDLGDTLAAQIDDRGFHGPVTDCIKMKSLCKQGRLDEAMGLLRELQGGKAEGKAIATATLVHALCKKGRFDEAVMLVEEFGAPEVYGVWTGNLVGSGKLDAAVKFMRSKKELAGNMPGYLHCSKLVFELLQKNQLEEAYDVLVQMMEDGIVPSRGTANAALCFFCKAGMVDVAIQLYHSRRELGITPSKWVYNHMMSALCRNGMVEEVCQVLEESMLEGYFPRKQAFSMLANMLCQEGKVKKLHELLENAREKSVKPSTTVLARCILTLCRQGELEKTWSIRHIFSGGSDDVGRFKYVYVGLIQAFISSRKLDVLPGLIIQMQESGHSPSRRLYMAVIGCLCEHGKYEEVLDLLNKQLELLPKKLDLEVTDPITFYNYFIDGAAHAKNLEVAMEVFNRMERAGLKPTMNTNIILLRGYLKSRLISKAIDLFSYVCSGREPNTKLYNIFISSLCEVGHIELAVESWEEMRHKGLLPSLQCYEELVLALCTARDYDTVVKVLEDFMETGRPISAFICNVLLLHTLKGKELLKAWVDFKKAEAGRGMPGSGLLLGELLAAFSGGIRVKGNLQNLEEDVEKSFPVDIYTYNMLLRGLTMAGRMDCACDLFSRIQKKGYEPNLWTYDIIVHGFCRQGNRKEAERWIDEMYRNGFRPTNYTMRRFNNTI